MLEQLKRRVERGESWPLMLVVIVATLVPGLCVLWFMNKAVYNERLADRQRQQDRQRLLLEQASNQVQAYLNDQRNALEKITWESGPLAETAPQIFAAVVTTDLAESVLVYDEHQGRLYPNQAQIHAEVNDDVWLRARKLEFGGNPLGAARLYGQLARRDVDKHQIARAILGQGRCLAKAGRKQEAVDLLSGPLLDLRLRGATDPQGRWIAPNGLFLALNLLGSDSPSFERIAAQLQQLLVDYSLPIPSSQRRFLMKQARGLAPDHFNFPMLPAENLLTALPTDPEPEQLKDGFRPVTANIWALQSPNRHLLALYQRDNLQARLESLVKTLPTPEGRLVVVPPNQMPREDFLESIALGQAYPGWRLGIQGLQDQGMSQETSMRTRTYYIIGGFVILGILTIAFVTARHLAAQMRLTYFKNDMIASVTHELKTPLASMRMLTDTLLEGHYTNAELTHEYLEMIARENHRLSRLIENFLTFSRMEQNRQSYDRQPLEVTPMVEAALATVREKMEAAGFDVVTHLLQPGPVIYADRDAMITVILNLLENAYKYSDQNRRVDLHVQTNEREQVIIIVADRGIGLSRKNAKRVFDRFYRVDQGLSRKSEGVGLGLNIVKNIVEAHDGTIRVDSKPGEGSRFIVTLPGFKGKITQQGTTV